MADSETSDPFQPIGKAGWIPIEKWKDPRYRYRFCGTERHRGKFKPAVAVAIVQVHVAGVDLGHRFDEGTLIWGMCAACLAAAQEADFPKEPLPL
jgi:hypothetical protein